MENILAKLRKTRDWQIYPLIGAIVLTGATIAFGYQQRGTESKLGTLRSHDTKAGEAFVNFDDKTYSYTGKDISNKLQDGKKYRFVVVHPNIEWFFGERIDSIDVREYICPR